MEEEADEFTSRKEDYIDVTQIAAKISESYEDSIDISDIVSSVYDKGITAREISMGGGTLSLEDDSDVNDFLDATTLSEVAGTVDCSDPSDMSKIVEALNSEIRKDAEIIGNSMSVTMQSSAAMIGTSSVFRYSYKTCKKVIKFLKPAVSFINIPTLLLVEIITAAGLAIKEVMVKELLRELNATFEINGCQFRVRHSNLVVPPFPSCFELDVMKGGDYVAAVAIGVKDIIPICVLFRLLEFLNLLSHREDVITLPSFLNEDVEAIVEYFLKDSGFRVTFDRKGGTEPSMGYVRAYSKVYSGIPIEVLTTGLYLSDKRAYVKSRVSILDKGLRGCFKRTLDGAKRIPHVVKEGIAPW